MRNKSKFILIFLLVVTVTFVVYSAAIFIPGIEIFLLPIMILLLFTGISSVIAILFFLFRVYKQRPVSNKLKIIILAGGGFCIGLILNKPVSSWDEGQRNLGGKIVSAEIEKYRLANGDYPEDLSHLDQAQLNQSLPTYYKAERFSYHLTEDGYDLDIQIPIMDRWHWNQEDQQFEYQDF